MSSPILLGHSPGGHAATPYAASRGKAAAVVCVEGFTLDPAQSLLSNAADAIAPAAREMLWNMLRYG